MRGGWGGGCAFAFAGTLVGAILGVALWLLFRPAAAPESVANMDGMNRWGGHMGAAMIGMLFGFVGGPLVTASRDPLKTLAFTLLIFAATMLLLSH